MGPNPKVNRRLGVRLKRQLGITGDDMTKQCKCEHWQDCATCAPQRFDADGKRKPPEPTPLQACRAELEALREALAEYRAACRAAAPMQEPPTFMGEPVVMPNASLSGGRRSSAGLPG